MSDTKLQPEESSQKDVAAAPEVSAEPSKKQPRTLGNKVFDLLLYPSIAFGAVYAFSVWFVNQATFGSGWAHQQFNNLQSKFGEWYGKSGKLSATDITKKSRGTAMMLVSFTAGTLLVMPIKWFEQYRSTFSHWFDDKFGKKANDPRSYEQEPRQSFSSIVLGRGLTFGIVLGIDQFIGKSIEDWTNQFSSYVKGKAYQKPNISYSQAAKYGQISKIASYEGFYTAVCASLLYVFSRGVARVLNKKEDKRHLDNHPPPTSSAPEPAPVAAELQAKAPANDANYNQDISPKKPEPAAKVITAELQDRLSHLPSQQAVMAGA